MAGTIFLVVGSFLLGATAWGIVRSHRPVWEVMHFTVLLAIVAIAVFMTSVGYRLVWRRPTRYGSLMTPAGWNTLGFVFVAAALSLVVVGAPPLNGGTLGTLAFALPCFVCAVRVRRRWRAATKA